MGFGVENDLLLALLKDSLTGTDSGVIQRYIKCEAPEGTDWKKLLFIAGQHSVSPLLYPLCAKDGDNCSKVLKDAVRQAAISSAKQSYRLLILSKYLVGKLREAGAEVIVLKGSATAQFYPVPEYRKSGDVDLLLTDPGQMELCCRVLEQCGCVRKETQHALHHVTLEAEGGIDVELHTLLAEPFDHVKTNKYLEKLVSGCNTQVAYANIMGVTLPVLKDGYHGYELLLHMLQHFLRAGFGLKLLCDWVVFWNREIPAEELAIYLKLVKESGLKGFSDMVTLVCGTYLGLPKEYVSLLEVGSDYDAEEFMREVLEAEEFGRSSSDRMVVMRGSSPWDYFREFHHQMRLNFPRVGKCFLFWPVLWLITLINFIKNNQKVRNVSTKAVFSKAVQRSKIIQQMKLWKC